MSIRIDIKISDTDKVIDDIASWEEESPLVDAFAQAGGEMVKWLKDWYSEQGRELWVNPSLPTHGPGRRDSGWVNEHAIAPWRLDSFGADHATITNDSTHFVKKVEGGTITPKNSHALTIPLIPEAHAMRAAVFSDYYNVPLFSQKGVLLGMWNDKLTPIYALKKSVTLNPWPKALPEEDELSTTFEKFFDEALGENE